MKRIVTWLLALLMLLSVVGVLASCKGSETETKGEQTATDLPAESRTESASEPASEEATEEGSHQHTPVTDPAKEATCTESGLTEGSHCSECGEILVAQQEIPAKGHTSVTDPAKEATCTEPGLTEGSHCSECGEILIAQEEIPAKGHTSGELTDCARDQVCTVCGEVLRPATAHTNEVTAYQDPTCTEGGYIVYTCKVCGLVDEGELAPLGHNLSGNRHMGADGKPYVTCSRCGDEIAVTDEEAARLAEIAEKILGERLRIVAYGTPDRNNYDLMVDLFNKMMEAGINTSVVNGLESVDGMWLFLDGANETGMDLLADSTGCFNNPDVVVNLLRYLDEEDLDNHIVGVYLRDEPYPFWFGLLGDTAAALREAYPESGWMLAANLLGWGNPAYAWNGVWQDSAEYTTYGQMAENGLISIRDDMKAAAMHNAMEAYMNTVKPDYICFDVYPFSKPDKGDLPVYLANLAFFQTYALKYDVPMWTFLQTSNSACDGTNDPTYEQIRCETNLSLAAGAKTLLCFTVVQTSEWSYMLSADGTEIRPIYESAKQVFNGVHAMKGVYLDYTIDKYILNAKSDRYVSLLTEYEADGLLTETYEELASADGKNFFIGCGKNSEGKTGLYVVNLNFKRNSGSTDVMLYMTDEVTYRLWGDTEGLEAEGVTDRFHLVLEPGEGCFIEINPGD